MTWDMIESKWSEMARRVQGHLPATVDAVTSPVPRKQADEFPPSLREPQPARALRDPSRS